MISATSPARSARLGRSATALVAVGAAAFAAVAAALPASAVPAAKGSQPAQSASKSGSANPAPSAGLNKLFQTRTGAWINGWAAAAGSTAAITVNITVDRAVVEKVTADQNVLGHPGHGFVTAVPVASGMHTVCVVGVDVAAGSSSPPVCRTLNFSFSPVGLFTALKRASDGSNALLVRGYAFDPDTYDPISVAVTLDGTPAGTVNAHLWRGDVGVRYPRFGHRHGFADRVAAATGQHTVCLVARNVGSGSDANLGCKTIGAVTAQLPPQVTPAPVSTSRYVRNLSGATATDLAKMHAEGYADAQANPSGHRYLILLAVGGQDQFDGGVVLSATTHFVRYANLEADLHAYVNGYHSGQRARAPITIAVGTNNDMDVGLRSGQTWASVIVGPLRRYVLARYKGMRIAAANDMEPGFRATYRQSRAWLSGYLSATRAPFVLNGSADGCSTVRPNAGCNNGWKMSGIYHLAAGAAPTRIVGLPQIYNTNMAAQWKYISLTGIDYRRPRVNFGGPLTEWTACQQARSCGSLTGHTAWSVLWGNLQSDTRLRVTSLPYSTDLRIDK